MPNPSGNYQGYDGDQMQIDRQVGRQIDRLDQIRLDWIRLDQIRQIRLHRLDQIEWIRQNGLDQIDQIRQIRLDR